MFRNKVMVLVLSMVALISTSSVVLAEISTVILYVKWDATGANNGTSWADAYTSLQDALLAATSDTEIWVAAGTYRPFTTVPANPNDTFQLKNGVALYGGFAGNETMREQRNWETNVTILDGMHPGPPAPTYAYHVVTGSGTDSTAVLDGFTIMGGAAGSSGQGGGMVNVAGNPSLIHLIFSGNSAGMGGGIYNSGDPILTNVTFSGNSADYGGGMANNYGDPTLTNVTFSGNHVVYTGGGLRTYYGSMILTNVNFNGNFAEDGGGVWSSHTALLLTGAAFDDNTVGNEGGGLSSYGSPEDSVSTVTNATFTGNSAIRGGGVYIETSNFSLTNIMFDENSASRGGGMANLGSAPILMEITFKRNTATNRGGGLYNDNSNPRMVNLTFVGNTANSGGGMENYGDSNPTLTNAIFSGNHAIDAGGGVNNYGECSPTLTNVTLSGNVAGVSGGGVSNFYDSNVTIVNSILWGNTAGAGAQIFNDSSSPIVTYSDIQGGYAGANNIDADPLSVRLPDPGADSTWGTVDDDYGNLHLQSTSPAIDVGSNAAVPPGIITDLSGAPRIMEGVVDMGAYEFVFWLYLPIVLKP